MPLHVKWPEELGDQQPNVADMLSQKWTCQSPTLSLHPLEVRMLILFCWWWLKELSLTANRMGHDVLVSQMGTAGTPEREVPTLSWRPLVSWEVGMFIALEVLR